jgi:hypothetical protein
MVKWRQHKQGVPKTPTAIIAVHVLAVVGQSLRIANRLKDVREELTLLTKSALRYDRFTVRCSSNKLPLRCTSTIY